MHFYLLLPVKKGTLSCGEKCTFAYVHTDGDRNTSVHGERDSLNCPWNKDLENTEIFQFE